MIVQASCHGTGTFLSNPTVAGLYSDFILATPAPAGCTNGTPSTYNETPRRYLSIPVSAAVPPVAKPCAVRAVLDARNGNAAATVQDGFDVSASYGFETGANRINIGGSFTYILHVKTKLVPGAAETDFVNRINNPVQFRGRANVSWSNGPFSANLFINHVGGYLNDIPTTIGGVVQPRADVSSWTTADLGLGYSVPVESGAFSGIRLSVNVQNLFDRDPPLVISTNGGTLDPQNANIFGRTATFQVTKRF